MPCYNQIYCDATTTYSCHCLRLCAHSKSWYQNSGMNKQEFQILSRIDLAGSCPNFIRILAGSYITILDFLLISNQNSGINILSLDASLWAKPKSHTYCFCRYHCPLSNIQVCWVSVFQFTIYFNKGLFIYYVIKGLLIGPTPPLLM